LPLAGTRGEGGGEHPSYCSQGVFLGSCAWEVPLKGRGGYYNGGAGVQQVLEGPSASADNRVGSVGWEPGGRDTRRVLAGPHVPTAIPP